MGFDWAHTISSISKLFYGLQETQMMAAQGTVAQRTAALRVYAANLIITS